LEAIPENLDPEWWGSPLPQEEKHHVENAYDMKVVVVVVVVVTTMTTTTLTIKSVSIFIIL
jgi:hypothetical protein